MPDSEQFNRLEQKIDRLLALIDRFEPMLERFANGGGLFGKVLQMPRGVPTFRKDSHGNENRDQV